VVEKIVDGPNDKSEFLIKWEGYPEDQNTWELDENLPEDMVEEYLREIERVDEAEEDGAEEEARAAKPAKVAKKARSNKQKIPGVDIAKVVDDSKSPGNEPARPPRIAKGADRVWLLCKESS
jgi:hypothetical protein